MNARADAMLLLEHVRHRANELADKLDPRRKGGDHIVRALDVLLSAASHALNTEKALRAAGRLR